jgi:hypothetical protein
MAHHRFVRAPKSAVIPGEVKGARFRAQSFFRPTQMSLALASCGVIPGTHMVKQLANTAILKHKNDRLGLRPSVQVAF